jgi:hypothetical protein
MTSMTFERDILFRFRSRLKFETIEVLESRMLLSGLLGMQSDSLTFVLKATEKQDDQGQPAKEAPHGVTGVGDDGTITFTLLAPDGTTQTQIVPLSGDGTYTTNDSSATSPGTYTWVATYSGDPLKAPASVPETRRVPLEVTFDDSVPPEVADEFIDLVTKLADVVAQGRGTNNV